MRVLPPGSGNIAFFDHAAKLAGLAGTTPAWPDRTEDLALIALDLEIERAGLLNSLGTRRVRLELLDYPGEWLLDLPLLSLDYATWSRQTLALLRQPPRDAACAVFLHLLPDLDPAAPADDTLLRRAHGLYREGLETCRRQHGLRFLQPGRFVCPGPGAETPLLWFAPLDCVPERPARGTAAALMRGRFEAYKADMRASFFDTHFRDFDRQVVLVDVLGALHAGRTAFEDVEQAIAAIAASLDYGSNLLGRSAGEVAALALQLGGRLYGRGVLKTDELARMVKGRSIERVAFAATKADHVPTLRRDNLRHLLAGMVGPTRQDHMGRGPVSFHTVSSVKAATDAVAQIGGRTVEVVRGLPVGGTVRKDFHPGDVPSARPPASFWTSPYFEMPRFTPSLIAADGSSGIPHLGLDGLLADLLGDVLS